MGKLAGRGEATLRNQGLSWNSVMGPAVEGQWLMVAVYFPPPAAQEKIYLLHQRAEFLLPRGSTN
jgi:hypothetical protein